MADERPTTAEIEKRLRWALGLTANVSQVIAMAQRREPILLDGPYGGEQLRVARLLHEASGASAPLLHVERSTEFIDGASVFLDLAELKRERTITVSRAFVERLSGTVPIIASSTRTFLNTFQGTIFPHLIVIPPLSSRRGEIAQLLSAAMDEHGFPVSLRSIGFANLVALRDHPWKRNLVELRECAHRLGALLHSGNQTKAAQILGISRQALSKYLARYRLELGHVRNK
jgi:transcriptional regulator with AAA-type ATPase domain